MYSNKFKLNSKNISGENINTIQGRIIKGIGGFYYVNTPLGKVTTRGRGNLKRDGETLYVGDIVKLAILKNPQGEQGLLEGVIEEVFMRKNSFVRPQIANVDLIAIVVSAKNPKVNLKLLDKFLCVCESKHVDCIICVNKTEDESGMSMYEKIESIYAGIYETYAVSGINFEGIEKLRERFKNLTIALVGPSGVGKSTILNALIGRGHMQVGEISHKTNRGKHTTRHVELVPIDEESRSLIFDTPGFTSLELPDIDRYDLRHLFPEMEKESCKCRFQDCLHVEEPGCAVLDAVSKHIISKSRYDSYCYFLNDITNKNKF